MANNNDNKVLNVPPLRFPEFSGEWKMCTIGELTTKVGSGVTPRGGEAVYKTEGHPFVRSQNVGLGNLLLDDIAFIDEETHLRQKNTELQFNDVLLNITGASIGRSALVDKQIVGGNVNQHVCIIRTKENLVPSFICSFLLSNYGQRQIDSFQAGGNRQGLNFEQIKSIKITIPSKDEQIKIAKLLRAIDERIATQNKIIEKLQSLIKGLNDHILKNIEGDQVCFADLGEAYGGLSGKSGDDFGCGDPFITYMNVYQNTYISENDYELVQIAPDEKQNSVQYGDALFTLSSETPEEVGMGAVYLGKSQKLYLNSFCFGVHFHGNRVLPQYIAHFISSTSFRKAIYPLAQGSTRFNLQKQDFMRMKFVLPSLEEQKRIATALDALYNHLANEKLLTEQYLLLKQYLLQQMFI
ncbi:MAG: restriction endonuclease subunit S [Parabacteroides merdae]|jgi:type I restriction enzyme S subunit|uniref:restriction endonuclease subunit S n=2 Tax=Parabacteroides merdae TaxID=46503 RepID=UPI001F33C8FD|nr:restriction endonuclease subunit S [Parabacteroides merdae]